MEHSGIAAGEIHIPYNFSYASASARAGASGFAAEDVGKFARQTDDNSIWLLTATTPTWVRVSPDPADLELHEATVVCQAGSSSATSHATGTANAGTAASVTETEGPYIRFTSAATLDADAGIRTSQVIAARGWANTYAAKVRTGSSVASLRIWVGLFSASPMASATPAIHLAAFRYDTGADGTAFWRCVTDSGSGSPTVTTTSVAVTADTAYRFKIVLGASDVKFYINDVLVATHTTTLPTTTTELYAWQYARTLEAVAKVIKFNRLKVFTP